MWFDISSPNIKPDEPTVVDESQRETPVATPVPVHVPQMPHDPRVRSLSYERFDHSYPLRSPDWLRNMSDGSPADAGDHARYLSPRPRGRESLRPYQSSERYEELWLDF